MEETTLDPENWEDMRSLGYRMIDDVIASISNTGNKPVWAPIPEAVKIHLGDDVPQKPMTAWQVYEEFLTHILPYPKGNTSPRFFAWVQGSGTVLGAFADMLAAAMNPNVTIGEHAAMYVDQQVVTWCQQMMGFPESSSGILVSGGSMANITAITVARNSQDGYDVRKKGLSALPKPLVMYCSIETHSCILKAAEILGLGKASVRLIGVDETFGMDTEQLDFQIKKDIGAGYLPFCVVATVGTVNTGAIDPLAKIRDICKSNGLWFHIDGAYGAPVKLTDLHKEQLLVIEDADSVAFDLHKWLHIPYEVGCVLIKDQHAHRSTFSANANYLMSETEGLAGGPDPISNYGFELSRGFKALKVWMTIKEHGLEKLSKQIAQNIFQAGFLAELIGKHAELELMAPVTLSIVCYRFKAKVTDEQQINTLNRQLLIQLQTRGIASPSSTLINGAYCIRVCIINHRTKTTDLETLISATLEIGSKLMN